MRKPPVQSAADASPGAAERRTSRLFPCRSMPFRAGGRAFARHALWRVFLRRAAAAPCPRPWGRQGRKSKYAGTSAAPCPRPWGRQGRKSKYAGTSAAPCPRPWGRQPRAEAKREQTPRRKWNERDLRTWREIRALCAAAGRTNPQRRRERLAATPRPALRGGQGAQRRKNGGPRFATRATAQAARVFAQARNKRQATRRPPGRVLMRPSASAKGLASVLVQSRP